MKKLAVIILNWNGAKLLETFLPPAVRFTTGDEVDLMVADNGSTDNSLEVLKRFPEVKVIELGENYGFAEGYNRAIEQTRYPYTILLNSDVEVSEGWWQPLLEFMENNPDAGACQPKILSYRSREMFEYAGAAGGLLDKLGYPFCRGRIFGNIESDSGQYDSAPAEVAWASGAAMMVSTPVYRALGGLDPLFFAHMEEIDLCWRIRRMGYRIAVVPSSVVYHLGGGSLPPSDPRKTYLNFRNNLLMLYKNLPGRGRTRRLIWRRILDTAAWGRFIVSGQWGSAAAIVRAHRDFSRMARGITPRPAAEGDGESLSGRPDILVSYYLRGLKRFSDLPR